MAVATPDMGSAQEKRDYQELAATRKAELNERMDRAREFSKDTAKSIGSGFRSATEKIGKGFSWLMEKGKGVLGAGVDVALRS